MAAHVLGKHLLVGLTYLRKTEPSTAKSNYTARSSEQVVRADDEGVAIELPSADVYWRRP